MFSPNELERLDESCTWNGHLEDGWVVMNSVELEKVIRLARDGGKPVCLHVSPPGQVKSEPLDAILQDATVRTTSDYEGARQEARRLEEQEGARQLEEQEWARRLAKPNVYAAASPNLLAEIKQQAKSQIETAPRLLSDIRRGMTLRKVRTTVHHKPVAVSPHTSPSMAGRVVARRLEEEERSRRLGETKSQIETAPRLLSDIRRGMTLRKVRTTVHHKPAVFTEQMMRNSQELDTTDADNRISALVQEIVDAKQLPQLDSILCEILSTAHLDNAIVQKCINKMHQIVLAIAQMD
jgi:ribosomal protein L19E